MKDEIGNIMDSRTTISNKRKKKRKKERQTDRKTDRQTNRKRLTDKKRFRGHENLAGDRGGQYPMRILRLGAHERVADLLERTPKRPNMRSHSTMVKNRKKHRQNSYLIIHRPTSEGMSEVSERANE